MREVLARLTPPAFEKGSVWLVGSGPGDPGLLTLHAVHALATADVVLHDALVAPEILRLVPGAHLISVGKRAGGTRIPQLQINQRLIALAQAGHRVVRLKGGDPLVFGRGGEEAVALASAGIPFRIVPGITAGIGGAASASVPITHRSLARSVAFATGADSSGAVPDSLDLAALSRGADVLVLYMGTRRIAPIAARLIEAGRSHAEAVAFITDATTARQAIRIATLATAEATAASIPARGATLIVIGPVIAVRDVIAPLQQTDPMTLLAHRAQDLGDQA